MTTKTKAKAKGRIGQSFDAFLKDEGILEQAHSTAQKRVIAWQLATAYVRKAGEGELAHKRSPR